MQTLKKTQAKFSSRSRSLNILFIIVLIVITSINIFSFYQLNQYLNAINLVEHTYRVIHGSEKITSLLFQSESAARGYIITKEPILIEDLPKNIEKIDQDIAELKSLVSDNEVQKENIDTLSKLVKKRIDLLNKLIALDQKNNLISREHIAIAISAQKTTTQIQYIISHVVLQEKILLKFRQASAIKSFKITSYIIILSSIVNATLLIFIIVVLNKMLSRQRKSNEKITQSEILITNIINSINDPVAAIDLDFKLIAFNLSYENAFKKIYGKPIYKGQDLKKLFENITDDKKTIITLWERALLGEEFTQLYYVTDLQGNKKQYEISFSSINNRYGEMIGASHIQRDVTSRTQEEMELKHSKKSTELALEKLQSHTSEMTIISEMNSVMQSSASLEETLEILKVYFRRLLPNLSGVLYLMNASKNYLEEKVTWNNPISINPTFFPAQCWALSRGKTYFYSNPEENITCKHVLKKETCKYMCVPLLAQNEVIGVLYLEPNQSNPENDIQFFDPDSLVLIENIANQISLALANLKLRDSLKIRAIIDPLTNLYNRSYLNESLERDIQRTLRKKVSLAIVMMDIDDFKKVNDTYGHEAGDRVLHETGKILLQNLRKTDLVCRYGGEEFLIALYEINREEAYQQIDKIRHAIENLVISLGQQMAISITASFGIAICPDDAEEMEKIIAKADVALYESKKNGKNKITFYKAEIGS